MRYSKLENELQLIMLLADSVGYTAIELSKLMNISRRQIYYLLDFIKSAGFILFKKDNKFHIDRRSLFFTKLSQTLQFTDDELHTIYNILLMADNNSDMVSQLRAKLDRTYNFSESVNSTTWKNHINKVKIITNAIKNKKMLRFVDYSSPHSHSVTNRVVEPFLLMNNNQDVRCHEIETRTNKTFRLNRIQHIETLNTQWIYECYHRQVFTDIFMFSSETHYNVKLRLGQLAYNIFVEEYPHGAKYLSPISEQDWLLNIEVCDFRGLGRFVLGLYLDIDILENDAFKAYIQKMLKAYSMKK